MNFISKCIVSLLILVVFKPATALYEDQIGKFDWRHLHIGRPVKVLYDSSVSSGKKLAVTTEENVLAVLNLRNGEIVWRHVFEQTERGRIDDLYIQNDNVVVVLGGGALIRCFMGSVGQLKWEDSFESTDYQTRGTITHFDDKSIIVQANGKIRQYSTSSGHIHWTYPLPDREKVDYVTTIVQDDTIKTIGRIASNSIQLVSMITLGSKPGSKTDVTTIPAPWLRPQQDCPILDNRWIMCLDNSLATLYLADLTAEVAAFKPYSLMELGVSQTSLELQILGTLHNNALMRVSSQQMVIIQADETGLKMIRGLADTQVASLVDFMEKTLVVTLKQSAEGVGELNSMDISSGNVLNEMTVSTHIASHHGSLEKMLCFPQKSRSGSEALRYLLLSEDHSIMMLQPSGKLAWLREEGMASTVSAQMVDLPVSPILAKMEDEFGENKDGLGSMFIRRFHTQFLQLKEFFLSLLQLASKAHQQNEDLEEDMIDVQDDYYLTRDEFNLHKIVVLVTQPGKIFGLDSHTGSSVWKMFLPNITPFVRIGQTSMPLFTQRTTAHFPHTPKCTLLAKEKGTDDVILFSFNPITGETVDGPIKLQHSVKQVMMLSFMTPEFIHPLLFLDHENKYYVYPADAEPLVAEAAPSLFLYTADMETGLVKGFNVVADPEGLFGQELWRLDTQRPAGHKIVALAAKPASEQVHSPGVVLGDRSVLYKYVNPNLVVLVTEAKIAQSNNVLMVYLVDSVTGHLVRVFQHKRCRGPVKVVHSEHWIVYSYWNQKHRRTEIAIVELYEGKKQSNSSGFSSLTAPLEPIIERQAFILNAHITAMATTYTEKGLTNKMLLFAMANGGILGLPKQALDARRPINPTELTQEEGLKPYEPELPRPYELYINYNQSVFNMRNIHSMPSGLESTSLIFCYGLDLFYTRVTPSRLFDVLKDDFDYLLIATVLGGMILASIIGRKMAANKMLRKAWK